MRQVPGKSAYEDGIKQPSRNTWDISGTAPLSSGVTRGKAVLLAFCGRAGKPAEPSGSGDVQVRMQQIGAPDTGVAEAVMSVNPNWQSHYVIGIAPSD